jgi:hypothetical protein
MRADHLVEVHQPVGSLPDAQRGDPVICEVCGLRVHATLPPPCETTPDPWKGPTAMRVRPPWFPRPRVERDQVRAASAEGLDRLRKLTVPPLPVHHTESPPPG